MSKDLKCSIPNFLALKKTKKQKKKTFRAVLGNKVKLHITWSLTLKVNDPFFSSFPIQLIIVLEH